MIGNEIVVVRGPIQSYLIHGLHDAWMYQGLIGIHMSKKAPMSIQVKGTPTSILCIWIARMWWLVAHGCMNRALKLIILIRKLLSHWCTTYVVIEIKGFPPLGNRYYLFVLWLAYHLWVFWNNIIFIFTNAI